ncbi:hypothetical protein NJF44_07090 [Pseudomonas guariconensis]|nr:MULTISPECIES: hypothetical protein [Pseudomonas]MCO7639404.1 hypothetical protein [Pseudomonas sp. S 311-6]MCO7515130.1 hypothetical protein [Pseudomonas putida]MCO7565108.1 hypothetical protein [Pseudomonas mosselii]MCO7593793.1 hypothetical protein [Pseudomonas guariconensis]MCO7605007.1 hypothetical protein [Pseudomonas guariconensis]
MTPTHATRQACRQLALEQNQRLFAQAYQLDHAAFALLERPGLDAGRFDHYQSLRRKAAERYEEALEHLALIDQSFGARSPAIARR